MSTDRAKRKTVTGVVTSISGEKTVKVTYAYKKKHPLYHKEINRKTVVHAHDEKSECGLGDKVEVMECRPLSRQKRWRVTRIVEAAPKINESKKA